LLWVVFFSSTSGGRYGDCRGCSDVESVARCGRRCCGQVWTVLMALWACCWLFFTPFGGSGGWPCCGLVLVEADLWGDEGVSAMRG